MKLNLFVVAAVAGAAYSTPMERREFNTSGGDGPYGPGQLFTETSLPQHTIYMPSKPGNASLPVLVWGNGGCSAEGDSNSELLNQIASYGYLAIASGSPGQQGNTTSQQMTESITWAVANAGKGAYANVDATKIMAAGFSCGGIQAYDQIWDSRVATIGIFSSGLLTNTTAASSFNKPILYCLGGTTDIAYENGERDFDNLPANTPSWKGNLDVGHGGTLYDVNGGLFGKAGLNWIQWVFRDDAAGKAYLQSGYTADGWQVETHALDQLKPSAKGNGTRRFS
ncbi:Uu.00g143750.m01.CDS01 [Anthostomella pinea]|uniref:Uu.00g143750.m01.CDS01 n=1 Tax=Anthostomella pinea TaxID=933095 RepID=A0AAI8YLQ7_9PEZI|nr:Uu.00g143750.m01.CDS01 [Anthostomella pinea]